MKLRFASTLLTAIVLSACGGSVESGPPASTESDTGGTPTTDSGTPVEEDTAPPDEDAVAPIDAKDTAVPTDHGAPSDKYPAFDPDMAELINNGGDVLTAPVVVTVTYPGDTNAASYEAWGDGLGASAYWKSITSEYGIGPTVSGPTNHVRETTGLPAAMNDGDIETYVAEHAGNYAKYGWPAPTSQSIYTLYIPKTTAITLSGYETCSSGIGGYHTSVMAGDVEVAYAVVLQCSFGSKATTPRTVTASHEIAEAATDPHPQTGSPGYYGVDNDHIAWEIFMNGNVENGDLCEIYRESRFSDTTPGFTFNMQRCWSNESAKAGHNPCVPAPTSGPYFNVSALETEKLTFNALSLGGGSKQPSKGFKIAVGETRTFQVGVWSDAKTSAPINLRVTEGTALASTTTAKRLTLKLDRTSGVNGEKVNVTVTVNSTGTTKASVVTIVSSDASGTEHYKPILISSQ